MEPGTGQIRLLRRVDREEDGNFSLLLEATDRGSPPLSSTLELIVAVQDSNDNAPLFRRATYEVDVWEGTALNAALVTLDAVDADAVSNGRLTFRIEGDTRALPFGVFPNSGVLYLKVSPKTCSYGAGQSCKIALGLRPMTKH